MSRPVWLAAGVRTPFTKVDGGLAKRDAIQLSVPVLQAMHERLLPGSRIDVAMWGSVIPSLRYSNLAREAWIDAGLDQTVPTSTVIMQCCTSMKAAFDIADGVAAGHAELGLAGGAESMSRVQFGLSQPLSDWMRKMAQARSLKQRLQLIGQLPALKLHVQSIRNRTTHKSMGEHSELTNRAWQIPRGEQDEVALRSHQNAVAGQARGFFADLIVPVDDVKTDAFPRQGTSLEALAKLAPAFDRDNGTITAGNASPLTDGAAALWVASDEGLRRLPSTTPRVKLLDYQLGAVDIRTEGLLMAPAYGIPRLLERNQLTYADLALYEIHEAFAGQLLYHLKALDSPEFVRDKAGVKAALGTVPRDRINPNGGSVALGHPFGATGARILSQAIKELAALPKGARALVSICADGGLGTMALLENS